MSKSITYKNLHSEYHALMANGAIMPDWTDERAAEMLIYKLNRQADSIVEGGSTFLTDDIEWGDFLGEIFSSEEKLERTGTGFEYRAIVEDACAQSLRTFIGKIKKVETKLALLKFFLTDDFRQNVLNKGYCAYGSSADMIQLQCAKLMGEINRSLHGEVAPDLADITDDIAADAGDEPVNSEQDIKKIIDSLPTKKMLINEKVVEIYQLPKDEEITPIGKLIASVNKGEVQARKADWKHLVQEGFRAEQTSPMTFMYWMQESLTDIKIRDYRVDALHTILENLPAYLQELEAPDDVQNRYKQDCMNLLHYFRQINYIVPYFDEAGRYWNEHRDDDQLDVETYLYFRFLDQIDDLKEYLDSKVIITPSQKDVLSDMVSNAIKDAFELEEQLKKEVGTKFYANVGAAFGFKSTEIQYGVCGDMGIRFGKGFLISVGVQYMLGDFGKVKLPDWNIEDMTVQAKIGWEW